ncbi:MAG: DUF3592 domain-containing protein [Thainema sp.]
MKLKRYQPTFEEKLSAIIGLALALTLIAVAAWAQRRDLYEQETMRETQGVVVDSVSRRERDTTRNQDKLTYAPVIEFQANGQSVRFTGWYESYRWSNGRVVAVRYDADEPATTAKVIDPLAGLIPWLVIGMGGFAAVCSLGTLLPVRLSSDKLPSSDS